MLSENQPLILKQPLVSIITPAHNASHCIEETIKSVLGQDYQNWELIVINDCSTDDTETVINKYVQQDKRIRLINNDHNIGVAETRNKGIKAANGNYIAFLDCDDVWVNNKLKTQISFMEKNNAPITFSNYYVFDHDVEKPIKLIKCPKKATPKSILKSNFMGCLTVVVNKDVVGSFSMPDLDHGEDMLTWHELMRRGFVAQCIPTPLAYYRVGQKSLSSDKKTTAKKQWKIYRDYLKFSFVKSSYYFCCYAIRGALKHF
jgi:teichuronic acid biosynthesis glycosyltransferase TuaG